MSGRDISDHAASGASLDDLIGAARAQGPSTVKGQAARAALADDGEQRMSALVDAIAIAQDKTEASSIVADVMEDSKAMTALATARSVRPSVIAAGVLRIRQRASSAATALDKAIAARASRLNDELSTPEARNLAHLGFARLVSPPGYTVDQSGISTDDEIIAPAPVIITGIASDILTGHEVVELTWWRRGRRVQKWVNRDAVMDSRKLLALAREGAPVDSSSATALSRFLHRFESANSEKLPDTKVTSHMGWCGDSFVLPERSWPKGIALRADDGLAKLAGAVASAGTWKGWCRLVERTVTERPKAMLAIYAAACTPLLRATKAKGFVVDWSSETSQGKTTALRLAASVWGASTDEDGLIKTWAFSSDVGPTTQAWFLQSLPLILDDTKSATKDYHVQQLMYLIPSGESRAKGTRDDGLRIQRTWRTCLLSTGESRIIDGGKDGGAAARTIAIAGSPLGDDAGRVAEDIYFGTQEHYGHLGPKVVKYIMDSPPGSLLRRRKELRRLFVDRIDGNVGGRLAEYVATLALAQQIVHEIGVPMFADGCDPIDEALAAIYEGSETADRAKEGLLAIIGWSSANQGKFWGRHLTDRDGTPKEPHGGWVGRWDATPRFGLPHWLCVRPDVVRQVLKERDYDVQSVIDAWYRRGWVVPYVEPRTGKSRKEVRVRVAGQKVPMMAFDSGTVEALL